LNPKFRTTTEVTREGFAILCDRLGMADAIRFVQFFDQGHGDYTAERAKLFEGETIASLVDQMRQMKKKETRRV